jgi:hypothetical protein
MKLERVDTQTYHVKATELTPVTGPGIGFVFEDPRFPVPMSMPLLEPSDAYQLGDALQKAARKAGYVPSQT